jgi:hypothetical protein
LWATVEQMADPWSSNWEIGTFPMKKDEKPHEASSTDRRVVQSLSDIFRFLEPLKFGQMEFFIEIRIARILALQGTDVPDGTRLCIVNFPISSSAQLFVDLIQAYFSGALVFPREPLYLSLFRRMQNYSIELLFSGYELTLAPQIAGIAAAFCRAFQENRLGSVQEDTFSIEVHPAARRVPSKSGAKKLSAKNTADSVLTFLRKRDGAPKPT